MMPPDERNARKRYRETGLTTVKVSDELRRVLQAGFG
jgi:hypothetical protein